jgi:mannose-6-phosphate isomerase-like protein (cupin superfamily)
MPTVIPFDDIRRSATAALFEGRDEADLSVFITRYPHGRGPDLHYHPYAEVFVVESGTATFTVGEEVLDVGGGHVVVVPPETVHGFKNAGDDELAVIGIHPSPEVRQTDL